MPVAAETALAFCFANHSRANPIQLCFHPGQTTKKDSISLEPNQVSRPFCGQTVRAHAATAQHCSNSLLINDVVKILLRIVPGHVLSIRDSFAVALHFHHIGKELFDVVGILAEQQ